MQIVWGFRDNRAGDIGGVVIYGVGVEASAGKPEAVVADLGVGKRLSESQW